MKYLETKVRFTCVQSFIETMGDLVWEELCDTFSTDVAINVGHCARMLSTLQCYSPKYRVRYLAAVLANAELNALMAGDPPPFKRVSKRLTNIIL